MNKTCSNPSTGPRGVNNSSRSVGWTKGEGRGREEPGRAGAGGLEPGKGRGRKRGTTATRKGGKTPRTGKQRRPPRGGGPAQAGERAGKRRQGRGRARARALPCACACMRVCLCLCSRTRHHAHACAASRFRRNTQKPQQRNTAGHATKQKREHESPPPE